MARIAVPIRLSGGTAEPEYCQERSHCPAAGLDKALGRKRIARRERLGYCRSAAPSRCSILAVVKESSMSKGMNQKKTERKKPAKSLLEKRAAKKQKRDDRASYRGT